MGSLLASLADPNVWDLNGVVKTSWPVTLWPVTLRRFSTLLVIQPHSDIRSDLANPWLFLWRSLEMSCGGPLCLKLKSMLKLAFLTCVCSNGVDVLLDACVLQRWFRSLLNLTDLVVCAPTLIWMNYWINFLGVYL